MTVDTLLSRLSKVRKTGTGRWVACCPAHDDKAPSLAVRELDDGRVLLHCFAGCETASVLDAVSLSFDALFPERPDDVGKPQRRSFNAGDVLRCLAFEALVVQQYATSLAKGEVLTPESQARLLTAASRFQHGAEVANA